MMIGRDMLEEEPTEESVAPGKGGDGVVGGVEFVINTGIELAGSEVEINEVGNVGVKVVLEVFAPAMGRL
jgi:hypothetical protein